MVDDWQIKLVFQLLAISREGSQSGDAFGYLMRRWIQVELSPKPASPTTGSEKTVMEGVFIGGWYIVRVRIQMPEAKHRVRNGF